VEPLYKERVALHKMLCGQEEREPREKKQMKRETAEEKEKRLVELRKVFSSTTSQKCAAVPRRARI